MDIYVQCCNLVSEDINGPPDLRNLCITDKQSTITIGDESMTELGNAHGGILHISDVRDTVSGCVPALERKEICHQDKENVFEELELEIHRAKVLVLSPDRRSSKCATFLCSGKMLLGAASMNMNNEMIPSTASAHSSSEISACSRSTSLPTPSKFVSAMKGSRMKQGAPSKGLTVTWAHDVYDPPATSMSHTVKSHNQQRSRAHKNGKQKHKGKSSSRMSSNNKKQYRKIVGSSDMRSKSMATCNRFILDGYDNPDAELVDFAVTGQDSKCGSSFLRTSLTKVHISVTEAT